MGGRFEKKPERSVGGRGSLFDPHLDEKKRAAARRAAKLDKDKGKHGGFDKASSKKKKKRPRKPRKKV